MKNVDILVRRAEIDEIKELRRFYGFTFGKVRARYKYPDRWNWLNRDNPFNPDSGLPLWIAVHNGLIVGHSGAMYVPCKIGRESRLAAWGIDTIVLPQYRGVGLATRLQQANQDEHQVFMSLHMAPVVRAIKKKIGGVEGPGATLFVYIEKLDWKRLFERLKIHLEGKLGNVGSVICWNALRFTGMFQLVSATCQSLLRAKQNRTTAFMPTGLEFRPIEGRFGREADELWDATRERFDLAVERSSAYLNWKFIDQPHTNYQRFYVFEKGMITGLVIFRMGSAPEAPVGIIAEIFSINSSLDIARAQIAFALECLRRQGAVGILCASSLPEYQTALVELGFLQVSTERMVLFDREGVAGALKQPCLALLTKGDQDWDVFPRASHLSFSEVLRILKTTG